MVVVIMMTAVAMAAAVGGSDSGSGDSDDSGGDGGSVCWQRGQLSTRRNAHPSHLSSAFKFDGICHLPFARLSVCPFSILHVLHVFPVV